MRNYYIISLNMQLENKGQCRLFGDFGIMIQIILGGMSFMVLVLKRVLEQPKRSWKIWTLVRVSNSEP